jgi:hypothetical protein
MAQAGDVTQGRIFRLWMPLEAAWLLMAAEGPIVTSVLARMAEPTYNLAAFGVAFAFGMFFESPIILIMSASTALAEDRDSFLKLRRFTFALNAAITAALGLFLLPPVFFWVTHTLMDLPDSVTRLAYPACALLGPWPAAIGYRRFYQGILIRSGQTRRIAYRTSVRLSCMGGTALLLSLMTSLPGAWVGAAALSTGVVMEALASRIWARGAVRRLLAKEPDDPSRELLTTRSIAHFYFPLALTSMLTMGVNPLVSFFLGHSRMPLESLAVLPVVNSLVFIFVTGGLTFQEVAITLLGNVPGSYPSLKRFATSLALLSSAGLILVAFTPLQGLWLEHIAGLPEYLARFASLPVAIAVFQPAITTLISFQRSLLVVGRTTRPITWAAGIEVVGIAGMLFLLTRMADWVGVVAAASAMVIGRLLAIIYLFPKTRRSDTGQSSGPT